MRKLETEFAKPMKAGDAFRFTTSTIGYYMVTKSWRYFIDKYPSSSALHICADKVLSDSEFNYWIDYYHGLDTKGYHQWRNIDLSDLFDDGE